MDSAGDFSEQIISSIGGCESDNEYTNPFVILKVDNDFYSTNDNNDPESKQYVQISREGFDLDSSNGMNSISIKTNSDDDISTINVLGDHSTSNLSLEVISDSQKTGKFSSCSLYAKQQKGSEFELVAQDTGGNGGEDAYLYMKGSGTSNTWLKMAIGSSSIYFSAASDYNSNSKRIDLNPDSGLSMSSSGTSNGSHSSSANLNYYSVGGTNSSSQGSSTYRYYNLSAFEVSLSSTAGSNYQGVVINSYKIEIQNTNSGKTEFLQIPSSAKWVDLTLCIDGDYKLLSFLGVCVCLKYTQEVTE